MFEDSKRMKLYAGIAAGVIIFALGVWYFKSSSDGPKADGAVAVEVEKARVGSIIRRVTVTGNLKADNEVLMRPSVEGKLKTVAFKGGEHVKKGDVLFEIDDKIYRFKLKDAEAALAFAESDLARYTALANKAVGSDRKRQEAKASKLRAEAQVELARAQLDNTVIKAPFAGNISLKSQSVGSYVDTRTELGTIVDIDPIKVDFRLPASFLKAVSRNQTVEVMVDSYPDKKFEAVVDGIDPKIDNLANSVLLRASIHNHDGLLKPGLFARVTIVVGAKDDAILIPESAVLSKADEEYIYEVRTISPKGKTMQVAARKTVTTGLSEDGVVEIVRNVREGDEIITIGLSKVSHGTPIRIVDNVDVDEADQANDNDDNKNQK